MGIYIGGEEVGTILPINLVSKTIYQDGIYKPGEDNAEGFSEINVNTLNETIVPGLDTFSQATRSRSFKLDDNKYLVDLYGQTSSSALGIYLYLKDSDTWSLIEANVNWEVSSGVRVTEDKVVFCTGYASSYRFIVYTISSNTFINKGTFYSGFPYSLSAQLNENEFLFRVSQSSSAPLLRYNSLNDSIQQISWPSGATSSFIDYDYYANNLVFICPSSGKQPIFNVNTNEIELWDYPAGVSMDWTAAKVGIGDCIFITNPSGTGVIIVNLKTKTISLSNDPIITTLNNILFAKLNETTILIACYTDYFKNIYKYDIINDQASLLVENAYYLGDWSQMNSFKTNDYLFLYSSASSSNSPISINLNTLEVTNWGKGYLYKSSSATWTPIFNEGNLVTWYESLNNRIYTFYNNYFDRATYITEDTQTINNNFHSQIIDNEFYLYSPYTQFKYKFDKTLKKYAVVGIYLK